MCSNRQGFNGSWVKFDFNMNFGYFDNSMDLNANFGLGSIFKFINRQWSTFCFPLYICRL